MSDLMREFNAASVEDALRKAAEALQVDAANFEYEVVDAGSEGFLGIGARDARIKVAVNTPQTADKEPVEPQTLPSEVDLAEPDLAEPHASQDHAETDVANSGVEVEEEVLRDIETLVSSIIDSMGLDARVSVYDAGEFVAVDIASDHTALLIGQKGETIDALQHIVNSSVYKNRAFVKRVILDSEGYRQRRIEALQGMAHRTARRSVRERRAIKLPPMNASERRVIHVYLQDDQRVSTFSEGSGADRRVVISPDNQKSN